MKKVQSEKLLDIFRQFLKFGCFTFGGGWSIVAQIQKEYVEKKHWITDEELLDFTSVGRSLPGLMIGNTSIFFGHRAAGIPGALAALLGVSLPPFLIMLAVTAVYGMVRDNLYVAYAMSGVRAAVVPIIISALVKLFRSGIKDAFCVLMAACALAMSLLGVSNILIVILGAAVGLAWMEVLERRGVS